MTKYYIRAIDPEHAMKAVEVLRLHGIESYKINYRELTAEFNDNIKQLCNTFDHVLKYIAIGYTYTEGTYNAEY